MLKRSLLLSQAVSPLTAELTSNLVVSDLFRIALQVGITVIRGFLAELWCFCMQGDFMGRNSRVVRGRRFVRFICPYCWGTYCWGTLCCGDLVIRLLFRGRELICGEL